jgi:hypothetical protein
LGLAWWLKPVITATQEVETGRFWFLVCPGKVSKLLSQKNKASMVVHICYPSHCRDGVRRIIVQDHLSKSGSPIKNKLKQNGLGV